MLSLKRLSVLLIAASMLLPTFLFADANDPGDISPHEEALNERDFRPLRDYLRFVRTNPDTQVNEDGLTINGDVRVEWRHLTETDADGVSLRGHDSNPRKPDNDHDFEFKLRFRYVKDRGWAVIQVQFDNSGGVNDNEIPDEDDPARCPGSGHCEDVCLKKAYMGYRVISCDDSSFDIEFGRRNLYDAFDSQIQFLSRYDGILFHYNRSDTHIEESYWKFGAFIVDEKYNNYAWVTEIGFLKICNTGFGLKYSLIDWAGSKSGDKVPEDSIIKNNEGCRFVNSQWTIYYYLNPNWLADKSAKVYGAFLYNHAARPFEYRVEKKNNENNENIDENIEGNEIKKVQYEEKKSSAKPIGWYVGFTIGKVKKAGDWALEVIYESVQAQAVSDGDSSGVGRGNVRKESFTALNGFRRGNTNFRGITIEGLYALTDQITFNPIVEYSRALDPEIGGHHSYTKFEIETIYAF